MIFHGVHVPQLPYPLVCWWASRLLPCPGYYKQCCDEHWGARVSFRSGFLSAYAQKWDCWVIWQNRKRDTYVQNRLLDSVGEDEGGMFRENSIETCILSIVKQITSPGWMHESSARAWCTGKTQRNRVEREVGGGIGMGNTCKSMADLCQCMTKPTAMLWSN